MYDVVVIGVGPAGSTAANVLAKQDYKVLLTERRQSCSGILKSEPPSPDILANRLCQEYERNVRANQALIGSGNGVWSIEPGCSVK